MSDTKNKVIQIHAYKFSTPSTGIDKNTMFVGKYSSKFFEAFLNIVVKSSLRDFMDGSK